MSLSYEVVWCGATWCGITGRVEVVWRNVVWCGVTCGRDILVVYACVRVRVRVQGCKTK